MGADAYRGKVALTTRTDRERLALLVHEVRSPTAALAAISKALSESRLDDDSLIDLIGLALAACGGIERVVVDAAPGSLTLEDVDVTDVARAAASGARLGGGRVLAVLESSPIVIRGDPIRLRQALDNLIVNAIAYSPSKSEVVVGASLDEANVLMWVRNVGGGIAVENHGSDLRSRRASRDLCPRERARAGRREVDRGSSWRIAHRAVLAWRRRDVHDRATAAALWLARNDGVDRFAPDQAPTHIVLGDVEACSCVLDVDSSCRRNSNRQSARDLVDLDVARLCDGDVARGSGGLHPDESDGIARTRTTTGEIQAGIPEPAAVQSSERCSAEPTTVLVSSQSIVTSVEPGRVRKRHAGRRDANALDELSRCVCVPMRSQARGRRRMRAVADVGDDPRLRQDRWPRRVLELDWRSQRRRAVHEGSRWTVALARDE